jgi:ABC-type multidrug transport system fused ATPase/permease subunit
LQHCDCVYVLDRGRIVQQGHHRTLLHTPGEYRRLAQLQMVDEFLAPSPEVA